MDGESILLELADREAIRDLVNRYAECVWRKDAEAAGALFTEDCAMDTGDGNPILGREALISTYGRVFVENDFMPFVSNHLIELDGDRARGTCRLDLRATMGGRAMIGAGHYEDEYLRLHGEWKFASRRLRMSFLVPIKEGWAPEG